MSAHLDRLGILLLTFLDGNLAGGWCEILGSNSWGYPRHFVLSLTRSLGSAQLLLFFAFLLPLL